MLKFEISLALKMLFQKKNLNRRDLPFAVGGLALGVATLLTSMSIMSGYESTLQRAVTDVTGHAQVIRRSSKYEKWEDLEQKVKELDPRIKATSPFVFVEGVIAHQGKISGTVLQGVDVASASQVTQLEGRLLDGQLLSSGREAVEDAAVNRVLIGKGVARTFNLKIGDDFRVVIPIADAYDPSRFQRNIGKLKVHGILDLGKYDWNERFIIMDLAALQGISKIGNKYSGLTLNYFNLNDAKESTVLLSEKLGLEFWVRGWRDLNENLFHAVEIERIVVFFVVLLIVLVAAFNMTSYLYVHVLKKYQDIAIFKTLGIKPLSIVRIFSIQGLVLALLGISLGFILGQLFVKVVPYLIAHYGLIQGSVYKVDSIQLQLRTWDIVAVLITSLLICFLATLAPAIKGSQLKPVEGLRYG
ncbi:MAG TPA: ABC transporter permease [Pseudobdellovibrionaceae bacterium]|nr:ABC transporter permease [Pseudobdellovibrionaceae bacterium]